jgi:hypothetical protein
MATVDCTRLLTDQATFLRGTASLGSTPGPLRTGRSYRSVAMGIDRGCPWMTAGDRCLGHVGGTAGEDECGSGLEAMVTTSAEG